MMDHIFKQGMKSSNKYNNYFLLSFAIMVVATGLLTLGCAGQKATGAGGQLDSVGTLYEVSEQEALNLAQWAVEQTLPAQKVNRLKKPRLGFLIHEIVEKGIVKYARFKDATFIYEIDLFILEGSTAQGQKVVGYTYTVKGDGDLKTGPDTMVRLEQKLQEAFEQSGRAIAVTSSQPHKPAPIVAPAVVPSSEPPKPAPAAVEKPAEIEAPAAGVPMTTVKEQPAKDDDVFTKLKKLKELRDQGIITEEEFQSKKKELLDRI